MNDPQHDFGELNDSSIMYFGKYKGFSLQEIPASYLLWLERQPRLSEHPALQRYIASNYELLVDEAREEERW